MSRGFVNALALLACGCGVSGGAAQKTVSVASSKPLASAEDDGDDDALELRLSAAAQMLESEGFTRVGRSQRGFLAANGRMTREVSIEPFSCARLVAVATPSLLDLDAALYRADGAPLIEDDGSDARPVLTLCAGAEAVSAYYALHAYQGVGAVAMAQFSRPSVPSDDLVTVSSDAAAAGGGGTGLSELAKVLYRRGFEDIGSRARLPLSAGQVLRVPAPLKAGDCYTLAAEADVPLSGLSLRLVDGKEELMHSQGLSQNVALQYCADRPREASLEVHAALGTGQVRVARFRAPQVMAGGEHAMWLGEPTPSQAAWADAARESKPEANKQTERKGKAQPRDFPLNQGALVAFEQGAPLGACEIWEAQLLPGLFRATLRLEDLDGVLLAEADSENMLARLEVCERRGPVRVTVVGRAGFGRVTVQGQRKDAQTATIVDSGAAPDAQSP